MMAATDPRLLCCLAAFNKHAAYARNLPAFLNHIHRKVRNHDCFGVSCHDFSGQDAFAALDANNDGVLTREAAGANRSEK